MGLFIGNMGVHLVEQVSMMMMYSLKRSSKECETLTQGEHRGWQRKEMQNLIARQLTLRQTGFLP